MYISKLEIKNFRCFRDSSITFQPGINILIGHNNAGKTTLLRCLQLIFSGGRNRLNIDDFSAGITNFEAPPSIEINAIIQESTTSGGEDPEDKNVVYTWIIKENEPYEAKLTYRFFLPFRHYQEYQTEISNCLKEDGQYDVDKCRNLINKKFLAKYVTVILGGDPEKDEKAEKENLDRFDFQYLEAARNAEKQIFYGNNTLLRDVLNYFLDYDITKGEDFDSLTNDNKIELNQREETFQEKSKELLTHLITRISKEHILEYSKATGANKGGAPGFDANNFSEKQLLFALRLIVEKAGFKLPIINNGLGYNNLLYIALVLARMQIGRSKMMGDNAKVFPMLAIEEPEAHLHPSMQYKFLKFLNENIITQKQARQAFITSHSTQITSAVPLDSIICLYEDNTGKQMVSYPGKAFDNSPGATASKSYVTRFLDATKSNLLFADRIIFVEGIAEQLLLPCFAAILGQEDKLLDKHVTILSVDGTTFIHFLKLFAYKEKDNTNGLLRMVACITDADPLYIEKTGIDTKTDHRSWKSCYPFQLNLEPDKFDYVELSSTATQLSEFANDFNHIEVFTPPAGTGKTLEYELAISNPSCEALITNALPKKGKNSSSKLSQIMQGIKKGLPFEDIIAHSEHTDINEWLQKCAWEPAEKAKALLAANYHKAIGKTKGEHSFMLEHNLRNYMAKSKPDEIKFTVPQYISSALNFILK